MAVSLFKIVGRPILRMLTAGMAYMKRLLQATCQVASQHPEKRLTDIALANLQKRYRNCLTRGEKELPEIPPKPTGQRGKITKSDAHNL